MGCFPNRGAMNKETLIRACGWVMWIAVGALIAMALMGFQNTPTVPSLFAYTVTLVARPGTR